MRKALQLGCTNRVLYSKICVGYNNSLNISCKSIKIYAVIKHTIGSFEVVRCDVIVLTIEILVEEVVKQ